MEHVPLSLLSVGDNGVIEDIKVNDYRKIKLMDLGFVNGENIFVVHKNKSGDPAAYRVRGTVIALRNIDANRIMIAKS